MNAPTSTKSQKDNWDKADTLSKWISAVAAVVIPIVIGVATSRIQKSISDQSVAKDYVGIATTILERPKGEQETNLRQWAVDLLNQYSTIKLSPQQHEELKSGGLIGLNLSSLLSG